MHVALVEFRASTPYPLQLANALANYCHVTLFLPRRGRQLVSDSVRSGVDVEYFRMPQLRQIQNLQMARALLRRLRELEADVAHITFWHPWGTTAVGLFHDHPLVCTVHDLRPHPGEHSWRSIPSAFYPLQWRWADHVIVHASSARRQLIEQSGLAPHKVHKIPIGAYDLYRKYAQHDSAARSNGILFFGRIWPYKGLEFLIRAEPIITRAIPNARIIIAGHGEDLSEYRRLMVNPENFEIYDYRIPEEEVAAFFQAADVVVLPYLEASQSGVIPIAYEFGKPVVASDIGGIPDVVCEGETGFLVPPGNVVSLASAVIRLLEDTELRTQMGERARDFARENLSWDQIAQQTLRIYQDALAR